MVGTEKKPLHRDNWKARSWILPDATHLYIIKCHRSFYTNSSREDITISERIFFLNCTLPCFTNEQRSKQFSGSHIFFFNLLLWLWQSFVPVGLGANLTLTGFPDRARYIVSLLALCSCTKNYIFKPKSDYRAVWSLHSRNCK